MEPTIIGAGISAAANLFGGMGANSANAAIADNANRLNEKMWYLQSAWQSAEADKARNINLGWQKDMADTSYRRAVTDMKAAGLNPMLAYSQGGAPTGSGHGGQAQISAPPAAQMTRMQNAIGPAITTGLNVAAQAENINLLKAQTEKTEAEAFATRARGWVDANITPEKGRADIAHTLTSADKVRAETENLPVIGDKLRQEIALLGQQVEHESLKAVYTKAQTHLSEALELYKRNEINMQQLDARIRAAAASIIESQVPMAQNIGEAAKTQAGQLGAYLKVLPIGDIANIIRALK